MNASGVRLFIFCYFGLVASGYGNGLLQLVNDLEKGIQAKTTVYYDLMGSSLLDGLVKRDVPSTVIREETDFELRENFNSQIVSIVFIGTEFDDRMFSTLKKTLHRLHQTDVLFITETLSTQENWTWLLDWCWTHGFSNVLLASSQQPAPQLLALYRLHSQQMWTTTLREYLERRNKWDDFQGYEVRLLVGHDPPYGLVYESSIDNQKSVVSGGNYYQMVKLFADRHNASLSTIFSPNNISFSAFDCIEYFETKRVDFCTTPGSYHERLRHSAAVAVVPAVTNIRVMVPFGKRLATYEYYTLPFKNSVWVALLLEVCCIAMATSFFYWRCVGSCDLSGSLLLAFKGMLYLGFEVKLACRAKLLMYLIVLCSGFIFTNLYLAKLSSFLSADVYEEEFNTLDDLKARGVDILIEPVIVEIFDMSDSTNTLYRYTKLVDSDTYNAYFYTLNPKYGYLCSEEGCIFLMLQQRGMSRPNLRLMSQVLIPDVISIPIAHECPFEEAFNEFFLRVLSAGLYDVIRLRTTEEAVRKGVLKSFQTEQENQLKPQTLEDLQVLPLILTIGYSAAIFTFCTENLIFYLASVNSKVKMGNLMKNLRK